jgi:hypothetical protein
MDNDPTLAQLRRLARERGQVIVKSPSAELYALVVPDNAGRGTDPTGRKGAALAFEDGAGMSLREIAELLANHI